MGKEGSCYFPIQNETWNHQILNTTIKCCLKESYKNSLCPNALAVTIACTSGVIF
jgi:hypothetical protein